MGLYPSILRRLITNFSLIPVREKCEIKIIIIGDIHGYRSKSNRNH